MKKITASILTTLLMLSMVFSSNVFAANEETSAWDSFLGLFSAKTSTTSDVGVEYRGHIQNVGNYPLDGTWVQGPTELGTEGKSLRLEGFWIKLTGDVPADANIKYNVHVQNVGWMEDEDDTTDWPANGEFAGTEGKSLQIEAIKIVLVDDNGVKLEDYSVVYSGHVQNVGDVGPFTNGETLGTVGAFQRLEAIEVQIVQNPADLTEYNAALAAVNQADYTTASWTTYQTVVNANKMTEDNLQSEVDAATANITAAQASLVKVAKVESVVAINSNQLQVTFAAPIKASSIISNTTTGALVTNFNTQYMTVKRSVDAVSPYTDKNVTAFSTGFLSADGKVLTLTTNGTTFFDGTYLFTASNKVIAADSSQLIPYAGTFTFADTVVPTVTNLAYNSTDGTIVATISEPIKVKPSVVRINGTPVDASTVDFVANTNQTQVKITKPSTVAAGTTATVYIAGATDFAGNQLTGYNGSVAITSDSTALTITAITQLTSNTAKIEFNKSLASATDATSLDAAITEYVDGTVLSSPKFAYAIDTKDTTRKTVIATYGATTDGPAFFYGSNSSKVVTFMVVKDGITDVFGNKIAAITQTATFTKDVTGPVISSTTVSDDKVSIVLQANEKLKGSAGDAVTLEAVRLDGVAKTVSLYDAVLQNDANGDLTQVKVTVHAGSAFTAGTYTIRLGANAIYDTANNPNLALGVTAVVSSATTDAPIATIAAADVSTNPNEFTVTYTLADGTTAAPVTAATALNAANYILDGAALPTGTDIYFDSTLTTSKVHIVLPASSVNVGTYHVGTNASLTASGIMTTDGKAVATKTGDVKIQDNTSAKISSVSVSGNVIFVKFNENLAGTPAAAALNDFNIQVAGTNLSLGTAGTGGATAGTAGTAVSTIVGDTVQIVITPATKGTDSSETYVVSNWDNTKTIGVNYKGTTTLKDANLLLITPDTTKYFTN